MALLRQLKPWYLRFTELKWTVGVAEYDPETLLDAHGKLKYHWVKNNPRDSWLADPFILSVTDGRIDFLVEQYFYAKRKARISRLVVNRRNWQIEEILPVIDIPTHLSFPAYFRENGKVYIYPESTQTGKLTLYEYDEQTGAAIPVRDLSDCPLADAVLLDVGNRRYILATTSPEDNGKVLDFYPGDSVPHCGPERQFAFQTNVARNAGLPFTVNGRLIRPAQDCTRRYGDCVVLQEIIHEGDSIRFEEVRRIHSPLFSHPVAFHTFNVFEDKFIAVDAEGFRSGLLAQLIYSIRESFR